MTDATKNHGITRQIYDIYDGISELAAKGISNIKSNLQPIDHNISGMPISDKAEGSEVTDLYNLTQSGINRLKKHVPLASSLLKDQSPYKITNTAGEVSEQDSSRQIVDFVIDEAATVIAGAKSLVSPSEAEEYETKVIIEGTIAALIGVTTWALKRLSSRGRAGDRKSQQYAEEILEPFRQFGTIANNNEISPEEKLEKAQALTKHVREHFGEEFLTEITDSETIIAIQKIDYPNHPWDISNDPSLIKRLERKLIASIIQGASRQGITLHQDQADIIIERMKIFLSTRGLMSIWAADPIISTNLAKALVNEVKKPTTTPDRITRTDVLTITKNIYDGIKTYYAATHPEDNPWKIKGEFWAIIVGLQPAPEALSFLSNKGLLMFLNEHRLKEVYIPEKRAWEVYMPEYTPKDRVFEVYAHMFGVSQTDLLHISGNLAQQVHRNLSQAEVTELSQASINLNRDFKAWLDHGNASMRQLESILKRLGITTYQDLFAGKISPADFVESIRELAEQSFNIVRNEFESKITQNHLLAKAQRAQEIGAFVRTVPDEPPMNFYIQLFRLTSEEPTGDIIRDLAAATNATYQLSTGLVIRGLAAALSYRAGRYLPAGHELPPLSEEKSHSITNSIRIIHRLEAFFERGAAIATHRNDAADHIPSIDRNPRERVAVLTEEDPIAYAFMGFDDEKRKAAAQKIEAIMEQLDHLQEAHPEAFSYLIAEAEKTHPGMAEALASQKARKAYISTLLEQGKQAILDYETHIAQTLKSGSPQDAYYYIDRILRPYDLQDNILIRLTISYKKFLKKIRSTSELPEPIKQKLLEELPDENSLQASQLEDAARARRIKDNFEKRIASKEPPNKNLDWFLKVCTLFYLGGPSRFDENERRGIENKFLAEMYQAIIASEGEIVISLELNSAGGAGQRITISDPKVISALKGRAEHLLNKIPGGYQAPKPAPSPGNVFKIVPYRNRHALRK